MLDIEFKNNKILYKEAVYEYKYSMILRYIINKIEYSLRKKHHDRSIKKKQYPNIMVLNDFDKLITSTEFVNLIDILVNEEVNKEEVIKVSVDIDLSKLDEIRTISNEVSSKLITEADLDIEEEKIIEEELIEKTDDVWSNLYNSLNEKERNFLKKGIYYE